MDARTSGDRVTEIFHAVVDLPDEERAAFLDEACGDDEQLRREVESLVANDSPSTISGIPVSGRLTSPDAAPRPRRRPPLHLLGPLGLVAALAAAALGLYLDARLTEQLRADVDSRLERTLDASVGSFTRWVEGYVDALRTWGSNPDVVEAIEELVVLTAGRDVTADEARSLEAHQELARLLEPLTSRDDVLAVNIISREYVVIFFSGNTGGGSYRLSGRGAELAAAGFAGESIVGPPFFPGENIAGRSITPSSPMMVVRAPVRAEDGELLALMAMRFSSEPILSERLQTDGLDAGADVFAFNGAGYMVSRSRHTEELRTLGLVGDDPEATTPLRTQLRDPGGDLTGGFAMPEDLSTMPLTRMAARATTGESGADLYGYRDVRGRRVVGSWRWLPPYEVGVAVEVPVSSVYAARTQLRWGFGALVGVLLVGSVVALASDAPGWLARRVETATGRVGPYRLVERIGAGGMATVYLAEQVQLRRSVALKLLRSEIVSPDEMLRFEREVKLISKLNHPNTIQIFDFGRTPDGVLYYAMELVTGASLSSLVKRFGPVPPERTIAILRQVCGSLAEAHGAGIVHRDIKPANIMICERSERADIVKLLDFGLARTMGATLQVTKQHVIGGTPVYIAPERVQDTARIDERSDLYSVGAVAFYLLTGHEAVEGDSPEQVFLKTVASEPRRPSTLTATIPTELDDLVVSCLARDPAERPQSAAELEDRLKRLAAAHPWTEEDARAWWARHPEASPGGPPE